MKKSLKKILAILIPLTAVTAVLCALVCLCGGAWALGIILPVYLVTTFFTVLLNEDSLCVTEGATDGAHKKVMSDIAGIADANPKYVDIAVLGSHDAVTDKLDQDSPLDPHDGQNALFVFADKLIRGFAYRFGRTQKVGIYDQILSGSRFLHIKCTYFEGEWYCSHAHLCGKLDYHLTEALKYLTSQEANGEILGFLFQIMYMPSGVTLDDLTRRIESVRCDGKSIFDFVRVPRADIFDNGEGGVRIGELTYNDLTLGGSAPGAVIFIRREVGVFQPEWEGSGELTAKCYDMDTCADHTWHRAIGKKRLTAKINDNAKRISADETRRGKLRMNQSQACFSVSTVGEFFTSVGSWSLLRFAKRYNVALIEHPCFDEWLTHMPVFQVDYVNSDYKNFNDRVNQAIRDHNAKTVERMLNGKQ